MEENQIPPKKRNFMPLIIGALGVIYLVNPGAGIFELIPDNFPIIGNLDEAAATALVIGSLRYYGIDILKMFPKR